MSKQRLLFVINQFFKGGAETALLNLFCSLSPQEYQVDFLVFDDADLPGTISLIPQIPEWIRVINPGRENRPRNALQTLCRKFHRKLAGAAAFPQAALDYVHQQEYDAAFSCGEWFSPLLVGEHVRAGKKYVWIHADIDKAAFLHPHILPYRHLFDGFLFVSEHSRQAALARYPELTQRSAVVYNMVDSDTIASKSAEAAPLLPRDGLPCLVTVANIRPEKNHLRQVRVMATLRSQGLDFHWLNIGSPSSPDLAAKLKDAIEEAGLENRFHLPGAMENPYPYMRTADAVCVLSDHESWSMVITEAKTLGTPVIATRTSGALAQLTDGETGILCDFDEEDMAACIRAFLTDPQPGRKIRANLAGYSSREETLQQLKCLLADHPRKVLYIFDDINYVSGARNAALQQVALLENHCRVSLFSSEPCRDSRLKARYDIVDHSFNSLMRPTREVLRDPRIPLGQKLMRTVYAIAGRLGISLRGGQSLFRRELTEYLESFDTVCVVSEASRFRESVAGLRRPRKIQWIHTDYTAWKNLTHWTRDITARDGELYRSFDAIVCLSPRLRDKFAALYPHLADRVLAIPNPVDTQRILSLSEAPCPFGMDKAPFNLITVGRMEAEKRYDRLLEIAAQLKGRLDFHWYFVGDGRLLESTKDLCHAMGLDDCITFTGNLENPYPLMKRCDLFVLISEYEGTPVTIDEAKVLGLPVLANDVGGVADMLEDGMYGVILSGPSEAASQIIHWANQPCYTAPVNHQTQKPFMRELLINTILPQP